MGSDNRDKRSAGKGAGRTPGWRNASTAEPTPRILRSPGKPEFSCAIVTPWAEMGALLNFSRGDSELLSVLPFSRAFGIAAAGASETFVAAPRSLEIAVAVFGACFSLGAALRSMIEDWADSLRAVNDGSEGTGTGVK